MIDKEIFLNEIEKFQDKQKEQKKRGLNNYNIMGAIRKLNAEVGMHSNFIYSLLDIEGEHYQGALFANLFVEHVLLISDFGKILKAEMEEDADGRRIDFTIKSDNYLIGIEMKIDASDELNQISDYYDNLMTKANNKQVVEIYYLTLTGKEASLKSHNNKRYSKISFDWDILNWLEESKKQVSNITNLNNAIGYYTDVVKMLTGKYESPINKFSDLFLKQDMHEGYNQYNSKLLNYKYFEEIKNGFEIAKQEKLNDFFKAIMDPLLDANKDLKLKPYSKPPAESTLKKDGDVLRFSLNDIYNLRLFFKKNKFITICIGINNEYELNKERVEEVNAILAKLKTTDGSESYLVGTKKGLPLLKSDYIIPNRSIENLFKKTQDKINDETVEDILEHIQKIQDILTS